ncbi:hypothetical protein N7527_006904 [Penicillium freii]|nr:hypothetical protein N7527_006904 [Penicillium freii]
MYPPEDY